MDTKSILGYQRGSPFAGNPYIDIQSNIIDMSNTPIDLIGIDNKGNKKKMKAGRRNPYKFEGDIVREFPMQAGGTYASLYGKDANAKVAEINALTKGILGRRGDPNAAQAYAVTSVNQPIVKFTGDTPPPQTRPLATRLPYGISPSNVYQTNEGYFYQDNNSGLPVAVSPQVVFPASNTVKREPVLFAQNSPRSFQRGGYNARDLYNYLFADDETEYDDNSTEEYSENQNTAPSEDELGVSDIQQPQEPDDSEIALQMAMGQDELMVTARNPYVKDVASVRAVGQNPYTPESVANISNPTKYAFEFFQKKGLAPHIAAGIVGNLMQESGNFRPDVVADQITGDNGASHGIAQWQKNRWPAFLNWASSQGKNPKALDTQLEYVYVEANQRGDLTKVNTAKTSSEAANLFAKYYERPAVIDKNRSRNARQLYPD